jgi:hypothetical protein
MEADSSVGNMSKSLLFAKGNEDIKVGVRGGD